MWVTLACFLTSWYFWLGGAERRSRGDWLTLTRPLGADSSESVMRQKGLPDALLLDLLPRVRPSQTHQHPHSVPCSLARGVLSLFFSPEPPSVPLPDRPSRLRPRCCPSPSEPLTSPACRHTVRSASACGVRGPDSTPAGVQLEWGPCLGQPSAGLGKPRSARSGFSHPDPGIAVCGQRDPDPRQDGRCRRPARVGAGRLRGGHRAA